MGEPAGGERSVEEFNLKGERRRETRETALQRDDDERLRGGSRIQGPVVERLWQGQKEGSIGSPPLVP